MATKRWYTEDEDGHRTWHSTTDPDALIKVAKAHAKEHEWDEGCRYDMFTHCWDDADYREAFEGEGIKTVAKAIKYVDEVQALHAEQEQEVRAAGGEDF